MTLDLKDRLYTSSEVAEILGVSLRSVYRYLEEGKLDADIKTATGRHRFSKKNILDFLKPQENESSNTVSSFSNKKDFDFEEGLGTSQKLNQDKKNDSFDDFDFDFDEEFFKSLEDNSKTSNLSDSDSANYKNGEDDELEKLLREFEESSVEEPSIKVSENNLTSRQSEEKTSSSKLDDFDADFELDNILKNLEKGFEEDEDIKFEEINKKDEIKVDSNQDTNKDSYFDFDLDFDFGFLENDDNKAETKVEEIGSKYEEPKELPVVNKVDPIAEEEDSSEDNWLERFRRAAEKNTPKKAVEPVEEKKNHLDTFFEDKSDNLDVFFGGNTQKVDTIGISSLASISDDIPSNDVSENIENYYISEFNNLKEIAQTLDKVAQKFDLDYAFTLNAGLSLHKPIAPFSIIHSYVNREDLEIFEDYLKLTPCSEKEASVCLITPETKEVFEDAHDLHGLYVVSNVQLRSDLIDKGLDKLAREI